MDPLTFQFGTIVVFAASCVAVLRLGVRLFEARRLTPRRPTEEIQDLQARLERIEAITETTALEVERIAEANRFMSKLLAERAPVAMPRASTPERVITPH